MTDPTNDTVRGYFGDLEKEQYAEPDKAVFYALNHAGVPLTLDMIAERPETDGHDHDAILEGIEKWDPDTIQYGDETAYHLGRDTTVTIHITREMYEQLRDKGHYIGEDPMGVDVHLSEDYQTLSRVKPEDDKPDWNTWGPMFPLEDDDAIQRTEPKTEHKSKTVMLEATHDDTIRITAVHAGMRKIPELMRVVKRTNAYYGPAIRLIPPEDWEGERTNYLLTCPDRFSQLVLWKAVTDHEGYIQTYLKIARVSAKIEQVAGYDFCEGCGEPIKDPMHRSLALLGQCPGGMNDSEKQKNTES